MQVTRPPGSSVFYDEQKILDNAYLDISRPLLTDDENNNTKSILHLYWRDVKTNKAYRSISKSNGLIWEAPQEIGNSICGSTQLNLYKIIGSQRATSSALVAICGKLSTNYKITISLDQGMSWSNKFLDLPSNIIHSYDICKSSTEKNGIVVFHYGGIGNSAHIGYFSINNSSLKEMEYPTDASKLVARRTISCWERVVGKTPSLRLLLEELHSPKLSQRIYDS